LLATEVERMRTAGVPVGEDDLRGLYVSDAEADRLLGAAARDGAGGANAEVQAFAAALGEPMERLGKLCGLSVGEMATLGLCLISETDPGIERLITYVQDDVSKKRPRVELAARIFLGGSGEGQHAFDASAPLRRHRLVTLLDEAGQQQTPLLARTLMLDPRIARFLLGGSDPDETLAQCLVSVPRATHEAAWAVPLEAQHLALPALSLVGSDAERIRRCTAAMGAQLRLGAVIELDLALTTPAPGPIEAFERAGREAGLSQAALLVRGIEGLDGPLTTRLIGLIEHSLAPLLVLSWESEPGWHGPSITINPPTFDERLAEWQSAVATLPLASEARDALAAISGRFNLHTGAISAAAKTALGLATARNSEHPEITAADLYSAARARSAPILSTLARKVSEQKRWGDLILEEDPIAQLRELCGMVEHKHRVYDSWGFGEKLSSGKGVVSLFAGQSGTGKTMGAGIIAGELELDLYKIDLSGVVSKYIGETEKNLGAIFREASQSNAILFFDEADALFGKRSEVRDAHDRYANIETAYLLQQIEEYGGPVILSTNLKMNLDEAFLRRMHFVIDFPMPEEPYRLRIWQTTLPAALPLADDVDLEFLAKQFRISGGNIRNIVLAAAFLAAAEGDSLAMRHLIRATRREFQKLGRMVTEAEFGEHLAHLE